MTKEQAERFERQFNHWASADFQYQLAMECEALTSPVFYGTLLALREEIIAAVKAAAK